jgi:hypothetical protein
LIRHLFVPGLFGPLAELEHHQWPRLPRLEALLARADRDSEPAGYMAALFGVFGIAPESGEDLPSAAVAFLGDTGERPPGFVLHADPLQLLPDRDQLLAFDLDDEPLNGDEIASLVTTFNAHFSEDGVRLHGSPSGRIYLHCGSAPDLRTHALSVVLGRNLDPYLPEGKDQRRWRGLLNETQMLCHSLDFNRERESRGQPVLGGLWFSGGGEVPVEGEAAIGEVSGDCLVARGLVALAAGGGEDELLVEPALEAAVTRGDAAKWLRALADLETHLPGLQDCASLHVHTGDGSVYRWHARMARRWWRRRRPLADYIHSGRTLSRGLRNDNGV